MSKEMKALAAIELEVNNMTLTDEVIEAIHNIVFQAIILQRDIDFYNISYKQYTNDIERLQKIYSIAYQDKSPELIIDEIKEILQEVK